MLHIIEEMKEVFQAEKTALLAHVQKLQDAMLNAETGANFLHTKIKQLTAYCKANSLEVPVSFARFVESTGDTASQQAVAAAQAPAVAPQELPVDATDPVDAVPANDATSV
jgi:hypothetical protein